MKAYRKRRLGRLILPLAIPCLALALSMASPAVVEAAQAKHVAPSAKSLAVVGAVKSCSDLTATDLGEIGGSGSKVISASETERSGQKSCEIEGVLAPSIGFKVILPVANWTQRYLQVGCGGLCGSINLDIGAADGCKPAAAGDFVVASTDMGHQGPASDFGRDAQKRVDFAYRGVHLTALASKKLINAFYGQPAAYSYFSGCSDGGREALMEAQRYPDDFDGIIAGAPALMFQVQNSLHHGWLAMSNTGADGKPIVTAARLPILHKAVIAACDGLDGQHDGLLSDPRLCHFDPKTIQCAPGSDDHSACLTPQEVEVVTKFYMGPRDPASGERLTVGQPQYGSELAWAGVFVPESAEQPIFSTIIAQGALQNLIFAQEPPSGYTLSDLKFEKATYDLLQARHPLFNASNPDLSAFQASGGKLILWHGWSDEHISPRTTIAYHEAMLKQMGKAATARFERLYLLPGVYHCGKGEGPSAIDLLTPMMDWVENDRAPDAIMTQTAVGAGNGFGQPPSASKNDKVKAPAASAPMRSRPVYPYPALARYQGSGDPDSAASYVRSKALYTRPTPAWAGADFFRPYAPSAK